MSTKRAPTQRSAPLLTGLQIQRECVLLMTTNTEERFKGGNVNPDSFASQQSGIGLHQAKTGARFNQLGSPISVS